MAKVAAQKNYFSFVGGLNTESSPLTYPDNASLDEENFELNVNGTRSKRLGIDSIYSAAATQVSANSLTLGGSTVNNASYAFEWRAVGGDGARNILVYQVGDYLYSSDLDTTTNAVGGFTFLLATAAVPSVTFDNTLRCQMTVVKGELIVVHPSINPIRVYWDGAAYQTAPIANDGVAVRDIFGTGEAVATDNHPTTLTSDHAYDLLNQGWSVADRTSYYNGEDLGDSTLNASIAITAASTTITVTVPLDTNLENGSQISLLVAAGTPIVGYTSVVASNVVHDYKIAPQVTTFDITNNATPPTATATKYRISSVKGEYPANSDIWFVGKRANNTFSPLLLRKVWFGGTPAPRGHYVFSAFNLNRVSVVAGATYYSTVARPSSVATHAGRVWWSGIKDAVQVGRIYYSQVVLDVALHSSKCYQEADPTSENDSALVDSDGGSIHIPEAGTILRMEPISTGLVLFASNGIWVISAGSSGIFSATGFSISKVSSIGVESAESVVNVEGTLMFLSQSGIYGVVPNPQTFKLSVQNISLQTIQTKLKQLSPNSLNKVYGIYDPVEKEAKWFYTEQLSPVVAEQKEIMLTYDLRLKAFYIWKLVSSNSRQFIGAPFITKPVQVNKDTGAVEVANSSLRLLGNNITTTTVADDTTSTTICSFNNTSFRDWEAVATTTANTYIAFIETGYELFGDAMRDKNITNLHLFFNRTELTVTNGILDNQSSCNLQVKWDWSDSLTSGQWTTPEEAYRLLLPHTVSGAAGTVAFDYGADVVTTKHNVRGQGRGFRVRFESSIGKDLQLLGWAITVEGNTK